MHSMHYTRLSWTIGIGPLLVNQIERFECLTRHRFNSADLSDDFNTMKKVDAPKNGWDPKSRRKDHRRWFAAYAVGERFWSLNSIKALLVSFSCFPLDWNSLPGFSWSVPSKSTYNFVHPSILSGRPEKYLDLEDSEPSDLFDLEGSLVIPSEISTRWEMRRTRSLGLEV